MIDGQVAKFRHRQKAGQDEDAEEVFVEILTEDKGVKQGS